MGLYSGTSTRTRAAQNTAHTRVCVFYLVFFFVKSFLIPLTPAEGGGEQEQRQEGGGGGRAGEGGGVRGRLEPEPAAGCGDQREQREEDGEVRRGGRWRERE